jgi:hypothetical protein
MASGKLPRSSRPFGPGWKTDASGEIVMSIKFGAKPVEFEKGKAGIAVGSKEKLPAVIDALIAAVRAGELDDLFSQAAKAGTIGKKKALNHQSAGRHENGGRPFWLPSDRAGSPVQVKPRFLRFLDLEEC